MSFKIKARVDEMKCVLRLTIVFFILISFYICSAHSEIATEYVFTTTWGSISNSDDGQFRFPSDIVTDVNNNMYIVDSGNSRIQKFDESGNFLMKFGSYGNANNQFIKPYGIAIDSTGNIFVSDSYTDSIKKFDNSGIFIKKIGSYGTANGKFNQPLDIAIDTSDNLYVIDSLNSRIQKFDNNGIFITKWGTEGNSDGQFFNPSGIGINKDENVYVVDDYSYQIFDRNGTFLRKVDWGFWSPYGGEIAIDLDNNIFITDNSGDWHLKKDTIDEDVPSIQWNSPGNTTKLWNPNGITINTLGNILIVDSHGNRIFKLDNTGNILAEYGIEGSDGNFISPMGIALDLEGNVYVTDRYNHRIQKFDNNGNFLIKWGSFGTGDGMFWDPSAIAVDNMGNVYVKDSMLPRIQKFDSNGKFLDKWYTPGSDNHGIYSVFPVPLGITVDNTGNVFFADFRNNSIQKIDSNGTFLIKWGSPGTNNGEFDDIFDIAADKYGNIYVADEGNRRIQKFDNQGQFLLKWGSFGTGEGQFEVLEGIAVDKDGYVYTMESHGSSRIQKFDMNGNYLTEWGSVGSDEGQMNSPSGIGVDLSGNVFVADTKNNRVNKFSPIKWYDFTISGEQTNSDDEAAINISVNVTNNGNTALTNVDLLVRCGSLSQINSILREQTIENIPAFSTVTIPVDNIPIKNQIIELWLDPENKINEKKRDDNYYRINVGELGWNLWRDVIVDGITYQVFVKGMGTDTTTPAYEVAKNPSSIVEIRKVTSEVVNDPDIVNQVIYNLIINENNNLNKKALYVPPWEEDVNKITSKYTPYSIFADGPTRSVLILTNILSGDLISAHDLALGFEGKPSEEVMAELILNARNEKNEKVDPSWIAAVWVATAVKGTSTTVSTIGLEGIKDTSIENFIENSNDIFSIVAKGGTKFIDARSTDITFSMGVEDEFGTALSNLYLLQMWREIYGDDEIGGEEGPTGEGWHPYSDPDHEFMRVALNKAIEKQKDICRSTYTAGLMDENAKKEYQESLDNAKTGGYAQEGSKEVQKAIVSAFLKRNIKPDIYLLFPPLESIKTQISWVNFGAVTAVKFFGIQEAKLYWALATTSALSTTSEIDEAELMYAYQDNPFVSSSFSAIKYRMLGNAWNLQAKGTERAHNNWTAKKMYADASNYYNQSDLLARDLNTFSFLIMKINHLTIDDYLSIKVPIDTVSPERMYQMHKGKNLSLAKYSTDSQNVMIIRNSNRKYSEPSYYEFIDGSGQWLSRNEANDFYLSNNAKTSTNVWMLDSDQYIPQEDNTWDGPKAFIAEDIPSVRYKWGIPFSSPFEKVWLLGDIMFDEDVWNGDRLGTSWATDSSIQSYSLATSSLLENNSDIIVTTIAFDSDYDTLNNGIHVNWTIVDPNVTLLNGVIFSENSRKEYIWDLRESPNGDFDFLSSSASNFTLALLLLDSINNPVSIYQDVYPLNATLNPIDPEEITTSVSFIPSNNTYNLSNLALISTITDTTGNWEYFFSYKDQDGNLTAEWVQINPELVEDTYFVSCVYPIQGYSSLHYSLLRDNLVVSSGELEISELEPQSPFIKDIRERKEDIDADSYQDLILDITVNLTQSGNYQLIGNVVADNITLGYNASAFSGNEGEQIIELYYPGTILGTRSLHANLVLSNETQIMETSRYLILNQGFSGPCQYINTTGETLSDFDLDGTLDGLVINLKINSDISRNVSFLTTIEPNIPLAHPIVVIGRYPLNIGINNVDIIVPGEDIHEFNGSISLLLDSLSIYSNNMIIAEIPINYTTDVYDTSSLAYTPYRPDLVPDYTIINQESGLCRISVNNSGIASVYTFNVTIEDESEVPISIIPISGLQPHDDTSILIELPKSVTVIVDKENVIEELNKSNNNIYINLSDGITSNFTTNKTLGLVPLTVQFTDNSTGNITSRIWSFGDSTIAENVTEVNHTYTQSGNYTVTLTVYGPGGEDSASQVIQVLPPQFTLFGNATIYGDPAPQGLQVTAMVAGINQSVTIDTPGWYGESEIGKGLVISGDIPTGTPITFTIGGLPARCGIVNEAGNVWFDSYPFFPNSAIHLDLDVPATIAADFSGTPKTGYTPLEVVFTDNSTGDPFERVWDFGDGSTSRSTLKSINHTFTTPGTYSISLKTIRASASDTEKKNDYITAFLMNNTITVTSPNGGENWTQGSSQTIRWNYTGNPGSTVNISVVKGTAIRVIAQNISIGAGGSGSFNFTFPYGTPLGSDYLVRITSTSNATCTDTSDAPFAIIPPITVFSPNGGEEWQQGSTQTISWHYVGDPGPLVKIEALRGNTVMAVITPGIPAGSGGSGSMNLTLPINTPLGTDYRIRISSPSNTTYSDTSDSYFSVIPNTSATAESYVFDLTWGREGSGDGQFHYPNGVAVDTAGNVYVADTGNYRIQKFSPTGTIITKWGSFRSGVGQFNVPHGIAVDSIGNVYITDANNHRIQKFNSTGSFITKWGEGPGSGDGQFNVPYGVAVDTAGNVYVADSFNHRIQKFNSTGSFITKWGEGPGSSDGQFNVPYGVAVDTAGNVYVADAGNRRIQKFNSAGSFITKWGEGPGSDDGQFSDPYGVATDNAGNVYIADTGNYRIQKFDSSGNFITKWGSKGSGDGQFDYPECVAVDSEGNVYVGDYYNHRIQKFHFSTICVILPNGGENWIQGSTQTIQWNYTGNRGPAVKIEALRGDKVLAVVTPSTPIGSGGSGTYNLTLPYNTPLGSDYVIRITSTSNPAWTDTSDDPFTVSSAIQLVSPNGGENWIKGSTYPITWTYSGYPGPTVKIEALKGEAVLATIASSYPLGSDGEGSYNVTLPLNTPLGNDYRFRITSTSYPRCTYTSEDPFTISG